MGIVVANRGVWPRAGTGLCSLPVASHGGGRGGTREVGGKGFDARGRVPEVVWWRKFRLLLRAGCDCAGRAVKLMQTSNVFSIGGSLSVNCHGRLPGRPPMISTVRSLSLLTADGEIKRCSRSDNAELFRHAIGGYGLFGV